MTRSQPKRRARPTLPPRRARRRRFGPPPIPRPATPEEAAEMRALWEAAP